MSNASSPGFTPGPLAECGARCNTQQQAPAAEALGGGGAAAAAAVLELQRLLPALWRIRWANQYKETYWRLLLDGLPTSQRMHMATGGACPCGHPIPDLAPLGRGDIGVPLSRRGREPRLEPGDHRLGQGDFRQQDQNLGLGIRRKGGVDGFEIDLGLA